MVWEVLVQGLLSAFAGIVAAGFAAWISSYRERLTWVENEVYQPSYYEIHDSSQGDLPREHNSKWDDFSYYKKTRVDNDFRNYMNSYTTKLQELSEVESRDDYELWYERIADELPDEIVERNDEERQLKASPFESNRHFYINTDRWYKRHLPVFNRWGHRESRLDNYDKEEKFREISKEHGWGYERLYRCWRQDLDPDFEWGNKLYNSYRFGCMNGIENDIGYAGYIRRQIQDQAREIEIYIDGRIEESIFDTLINNLRNTNYF